MSSSPDQAAIAPKTSGLAIASLITSITCLSPIAIICGHMALSKIKKSGGLVNGFGLALAGTIMGYVGLVISVLFVVPVLFVGARAYKVGSDRAGCMMMQRNVEGLIQGYASMHSLEEGGGLDMEKIVEALMPEGELDAHCPEGGELIISPVYLGPNESHSKCLVPEHTMRNGLVTDY